MIDFIKDLLCIDHPGLSYAVMDPLTLSLLLKGGSALASGVGKIVSGRKDQKEAEANIEQLKGEESELKKKRTYGVGEGWNKYLSAVKQDKGADLARAEAAKSFSSGVSALGRTGAKGLLGGLSQMTAQADASQAKIAADEQARLTQGLSAYANVEQASKDANVRLAGQDLKRTQGLLDDQEQNRIEARGTKRAGIQGVISSGLNIAGDFAEDEAIKQKLIDPAKYGAKVYSNGGETDPTEDKLELSKGQQRKEDRFKRREERYDDRVKFNQKLQTAAPDLFKKKGRALDAINQELQRQREEREQSFDPSVGQETQQVQQQSSDEFKQYVAYGNEQGWGDLDPTSEDDNPKILEAVAAMRKDGLSDEDIIMILPQLDEKTIGSYKRGGVMKTPGSFSHARNPIDIMRNGAKIGEMTGGEYIFNPRQASTLQNLSLGGDSRLHRYVKGLLREFENRR